jgi:hypothetical protein
MNTLVTSYQISSKKLAVINGSGGLGRQCGSTRLPAKARMRGICGQAEIFGPHLLL